MPRLWMIALITAALPVFFSSTHALAADITQAQDLYVQAIAAMSDLPQPPYLTYRLEGESQGLAVDLTTIGGNVWLSIHPGNTPQSWMLRHETYDYKSEIVNVTDNKRYISARSFFDPTWYGAYRALREGMLDSQDPAPPHPSPGASATPDPETTLKTIEVTSVMGPDIYRVEDRGPTTCSNGNAARALHLTPLVRSRYHQLTDVAIDLTSMRFCMMRFAWDGPFGFHGIVEQHYADVGGYWLETDGLLDGTLRAFGISTHHGVWLYRLLDMQFPSSLPPDTFTSNVVTTPNRVQRLLQPWPARV